VPAFVECGTEEILEPVDRRQLVWTIPRVLRPTRLRSAHPAVPTPRFGDVDLPTPPQAGVRRSAPLLAALGLSGLLWAYRRQLPATALCPRCGNQMEIIAFIEEGAVIRKILQHLGLWDRPQRSPPPPRPFPYKREAFLATPSPR
jgi:hypothetical protein